MDAGVPIAAPVAGVAMGLIMGEDGKYKVLTDIAGLEDAMGDMDFKVAGTEEGITALQMDIKIQGIPMAVMKDAVKQARDGRLFIMGKMLEALPEPRAEMSPYAPRMYRLQIDPQKIGTVIGPGGRVIRSIIEETGCTVDIEDDGSVFIGATDEESARKAIDIIEGMTKDVEVGQIYTGRVARIMNFGAFVEIAPGKDGLVHISELADFRVPSVEDVVSIGDEVSVMVTEIDSMGRINLSRRAVLAGETDAAAVVARQKAERESRPPRDGGGGGRGGGGGYGGGGGGRDRGPRNGGGVATAEAVVAVETADRATGAAVAVVAAATTADAAAAAARAPHAAPTVGCATGARRARRTDRPARRGRRSGTRLPDRSRL